jgi:hypothetical protein
MRGIKKSRARREGAKRKDGKEDLTTENSKISKREKGIDH